MRGVLDLQDVNRDIAQLDQPPFDILQIKKTPHEYLRGLDNALQIASAAAADRLESTILHNLLRQPGPGVVFKVGSYCLIANNRPKTNKLQKFAPTFAGPLRVVENYGNDFYRLMDLVQDEDQIFVHTCDMREFACANDDEVRNIAVTDYDEFRILEIVGIIFFF
jgi:hypothetical protein